MSDLLGFVFESALEIVFEVLGFEQAWRFYLPVLSALGLLVLINWLISNSGLQLCLSAPVVLAGFATGIIWHARNG